MMISAGWGLFPVYRLVLDAKPDRVMMWLTGNHWACSGISWQTRHQMARQSHFASSARGFLGFCFISSHRIFVTTSHYFDLSSYKKCGPENKYLLTFSRSSSPKKPSTLRRKNPQTPRKKFLSNVKKFISEVKMPFFGAKKEEKTRLFRALSTLLIQR